MLEARFGRPDELVASAPPPRQRMYASHGADWRMQYWCASHVNETRRDKRAHSEDMQPGRADFRGASNAQRPLLENDHKPRAHEVDDAWEMVWRNAQIQWDPASLQSEQKPVVG